MSDFVVRPIKVVAYPLLKLDLDKETGEIVKSYKARKVKNGKPLYKKLPMILDPNGIPLYPENFFLHSLMNNEGMKYETVLSISQGLLAFNRFLYASYDEETGEKLTYRSLTANPEEGAPFLFGDFLFDNLRQTDPTTGVVIEEGIAPSTAMNYIRNVARFYAYMISSKILTVSNDYLPYNKKTIKIPKGGWSSKHSNANSNALSHLQEAKSNKPKSDNCSDNEVVTIETSDLVARFTNLSRQQTVAPHKKLKPMSALDGEIFDEYLAKNKNQVCKLMCELSIESGLRAQEIVSFPESVIKQPMSDPVKVTIGLANGCKTKFDKQRTVEVPYSLMEKLVEYKHSNKRCSLLEKHAIQTDKDGNQIGHNGRLFISHSKANMYSKNTLQKFMSNVRSDIREKHKNWYYRVHDMRSTFATRWLLARHTETELPLAMLMDDLKELMGHDDDKETQKYVTFLEEMFVLHKHSSNKNNRASELY